MKQQLNTQPKKSRKRWIFLSSFVCLCTFFFSKFLFFAISPHFSSIKKESILQVLKNEPPKEIAHVLFSHHLISNEKYFIWLGKITRQWKNIKIGEYKISSAMSPLKIFSVLTSGISIAYPVVIREGENIYEIAKTLMEKKIANPILFLSLCKDKKFIASFHKYFYNSPPPSSLEGYLAPDTYFFNKSMSEQDIIRQMVKHSFDSWTAQEKKRLENLKWNTHQIITLASIIEKETGAAEERPIISSVFHNRLKKKMRLQSDPTTIYGMWVHYKGKIHKKDLLMKNPFNTYAVDGLPIGPIANPSKEAIHAALFPIESPYLYFVSRNDGTHQFSKNIKEHHLAVQKFQFNPKAREGKSWKNRIKNSFNNKIIK